MLTTAPTRPRTGLGHLAARLLARAADSLLSTPVPDHLRPRSCPECGQELDGNARMIRDDVTSQEWRCKTCGSASLWDTTGPEPRLLCWDPSHPLRIAPGGVS
jgi:uncharacterized alpha-E superfamily protein